MTKVHALKSRAAIDNSADAAKASPAYPTNASRIRANMPGCFPPIAARM
jgi:hypothetical protein